mmetsp:Transcript_58921/g.117066  ORF Transcript_58921/g.117066 Transcript_58921/m.117066 type:complete len:277 (+) Transcript_58921:258-1088(+)
MHDDAVGWLVPRADGQRSLKMCLGRPPVASDEGVHPFLEDSLELAYHVILTIPLNGLWRYIETVRAVAGEYGHRNRGALETYHVHPTQPLLNGRGELGVEGLTHEDVDSIHFGCTLQTRGEVDVGREVGAIYLNIGAHRTLNGPAVMEAVADACGVVPVKKLDNFLVLVVGLQLIRARDAAHAPSEGGERAVAHFSLGGLHLRIAGLTKLVNLAGRVLRLPYAKEGLPKIAVGLAAVVRYSLVDDASRRVGEGQDLLAETLEDLFVFIDDAEAVRT